MRGRRGGREIFDDLKVNFEVGALNVERLKKSPSGVLVVGRVGPLPLQFQFHMRLSHIFA